MLNEHKDKLVVSLTETIENWLEKNDDIPLPFIGYNVSQIMAQAALCVLRGIADTQEWLEKENLLEEDAS